MKIYNQVCVGTLDNPVGFYRYQMVKDDPIPLGTRYSSNINMHISNRAGLFPNIKTVQIKEPVKLKNGQYTTVKELSR